MLFLNKEHIILGTNNKNYTNLSASNLDFG